MLCQDCDNTSVVTGHSKKTMRQVFNDHHKLLCGMGDGGLTQATICSADAFVSHAFHVPDYVHTTNDAGFMLYSRVKKPEALPSTSDTLKLHITRVHYHSMVWNQANCSQPNLQSPTDSGWNYEDGRHIPILMSLQSLPESCMEPVSNQCKLVVRHCAVRVVNPK